MKVEYRALDATFAEQVRPWTFPAYRHLLDFRPTVRMDGLDRRTIAARGVVALEDGKPRGALLGCVPDASDTLGLPNPPEILSLYVERATRGRGLGAGLVAEFERSVAAAGFGHVEAVYMTGPKEIEFVERILARRGWAPPAPRMLVLKATLAQFKKTPWCGRLEAPAGFELFPWSQIGAGEMACLKASQERSPWIPTDLLPWRHSALDASSVGIRHKGEVVGWVLNHRLSDEVVRFTCSFVRADLARRARIIPAYSEALRLVEEAGYRRLTFTVPMRHPQMVAFARRWCAPWCESQVETRGSSKSIAPAWAAA